MVRLRRLQRAARIGLVAAGALAVVFVGAAASAQSYTYNYSGEAAGTAGSFTVTNTGGTYSLTQFAGTVNGASYTTATVGLASGSNGYYYLGGLANGIDYFTGANDFTESGAFLPGNGPFRDSFQYYIKPGVAEVTNVNFTVPNQNYAYTYTSYDPTRTSGAFTVSNSNGVYSLSSFAGKVNGVSYDTSTVGLAPGSNGSYYLGALVNGIDYFTGMSDFTESGAFLPGTQPVYDSFQYYVSPGQASLTEVTFTPLLRASSIASVPEPASWEMMLAAFAVIGSRLRRRSAEAALRLS